MSRLLFITVWTPDQHWFPSIPLYPLYTFYLSYTLQLNDIFYQHVFDKIYNYIFVSKTENLKLTVGVIRENCSRLTQRISIKRSILSWRLCTSLCPFQIFILKKRKDLTFIEHLFSKYCDKHFPYIISFVFSQQLCKEVLLHGSLENPEMSLSSLLLT